MSDRLGVTLHEHEERYAVVRADPFVYAPRVALGIAWFLLPFFFFFPLLRLGWFGVAFAALLAVGALVYLAALRARWFGSALVLTNARCIDVERRGLGVPHIIDVPWHEVQRVRMVHRGFWRKLFGICAVRVDLDPAHDFAVEFGGLRKAEQIRDLVHEVQCLHHPQRKEV